MIRKTAPFLIVLLSSAVARADGRPLVEESRNVGEFNGIRVTSGIVAHVREGTRGPIAIKGEAAALKRLRLEINADHVLEVKYASSNEPLAVQQATVVTIQVPRVASLAASGGATIDASVPVESSIVLAAAGGAELYLRRPLTADRVTVAASGGSRMVIAGIEAKDAEIALNGGARVSVSGRADEVELQIAGGATLEAQGLTTGSLHVAGASGAEAAVRAGRASGALAGARLRLPASAQTSIAEAAGAEVVKDL